MTEDQVAVPVWVPEVVAKIAGYIVNAVPDPPQALLDVVMRLLSHPDMRDVWTELSKRARKPDDPASLRYWKSTLPREAESWTELAAAFRRKSKDLQKWGDDIGARESAERALAAERLHASQVSRELNSDERHDMALATVFLLAVSHYCAGLETLKNSDFSSFLKGLEAQGDEKLASILKRESATPEVSRYFVKRRRTDPRVEAFIEGMAARMGKIFPVTLYGVIATLTNAVFEREDFNRQKVRAILGRR